MTPGFRLDYHKITSTFRTQDHFREEGIPVGDVEGTLVLSPSSISNRRFFSDNGAPTGRKPSRHLV